MANSSSISSSLPSWAPQRTFAVISTHLDSPPNPKSPSDWHILGAGAMGQLLATRFIEAGFDLSLVTRPEPEPAKVSQIVHRVYQGQTKTFALRCEPANLHRPIQQLLVVTKSNQVLQALADVAPRLSATSNIVLLHNGMGTLAPAQQQFSAAQIYCGVTTQGAYWSADDPTQLVYAGQGTTEIGQMGKPQAPAWLLPVLSSNLGFTWQSNIDAVRWRKLLINCAINPLTAIHRCHNGELLNNEALRAQLHLVVDELAAVANAAGYSPLAEKLFSVVEQVLVQTRDNFSSMQQDVQHKRATEIGYINGYLCNQARLHDVATPMNTGLVAAVRHIEQTYGSQA